MNIIVTIYVATVLLGLISFIIMILSELDKYKFDSKIQTRKNWLKETISTYSVGLIYFIPVFNIVLTTITTLIIRDIIKR